MSYYLTDILAAHLLVRLLCLSVYLQSSCVEAILSIFCGGATLRRRMEANARELSQPHPNTVFRLLEASEAPPEVTGSGDLLQHFGLKATLEKTAPPEYVAKSSYLKTPVGDTSLRRGQGMELGQLLDGNWPGLAHETAGIAPLGLDALRSAFTFRSEEAVELAQDDLGAPTYTPPVTKTKDRSNGKNEEDRKKKKKDKSKHKDREKSREKDKDHKKDKHKKRKHRENEEGDDQQKSKKSKKAEGGS